MAQKDGLEGRRDEGWAGEGQTEGTGELSLLLPFRPLSLRAKIHSRVHLLFLVPSFATGGAADDARWRNVGMFSLGALVNAERRERGK